MARKMGPEGPKLQIRIINGRHYAYTSTSRMIDGKKKTINECVGRYDPQTGVVTPKKPRKSKEEYERIRMEMNPPIDFSKVGSRTYGPAYLMDALQRRLRLGEDIARSFGSSAKAIMTCSMALAINPGPFSSIENTFLNTYLRDLYDVRMDVGSQQMSEFTHNIGLCGECKDQFFENRVLRCDGLVAWDTTTNSTYSNVGGMAEWGPSKDGDDLKVVKKGMATDMRGIPLMYRFYPGSLSDLATVERLQGDLERYGRSDILHVMDRGFCSGANMHGLIERNRSFVVPSKESKAMKTLLTEFKRTNEKVTRVYDGHAYTIWRTEVGLRESARVAVDGSPAYDFTTHQDEGHASAGAMTAYVCYDTKKFSDEVQSRELLIDSLMEFARDMDVADPVRAFKRRAGKALKYFDVKPDGRKVSLTLKKNARSFNDNRAGMFVMLCSQNVSWELMMAAYDARRLTEQAFDTEKERDRRPTTGDPVTLEGRYLIQFIAQILLAEIRATLREKDADSKYTIEGILATLSTLNVLEYGGQRGLSEITRNVRRVLELFQVEVPTKPMYHEEMFDPKLLMESVPRGPSILG